MEPLIEEAAVV